MSTTNLPTPSSNRDEEIEQVLKNYRDGLCQLAHLQRVLGYETIIEFTEALNYRNIESNVLFDDHDIPVEASHIRNMLQKYIDHDISETALSDWATIIFSSAAYVPAGQTDEERDKAGDSPTWDILQRLISPHIFDGLDKPIAKRYLQILNES